MRGKLTNISVGLLNLILGISIILIEMFLPQDIMNVTIQEKYVIELIQSIIPIMFCIVVLYNLIFAIVQRRNALYLFSYVSMIFVLGYIMYPNKLFSIICFISCFFIIIKSLVENVIERNNLFSIFLTLIIDVAILIVVCTSYFYPQIAIYLRNKENKNELAYKSTYFQYVTELDIQEPYINVKKDGKYGYINSKGETVIDFKYDYASRFVNISSYGKTFQVALVCKDESTYIIMKNERKVLSYRTESLNENIEEKEEELLNVYKNILKQQGTPETEFQIKTDDMTRKPAYKKEDAIYTYRYNYNEKYDLGVIESSTGLKDRFELIEKNNPSKKIVLDESNICYDENYLYVYKNNYIPFYDTAKKRQGWFTDTGKKRALSGNAQILDLIDDKILLRNYNYSKDSIYFINSTGSMVSDNYEDIFLFDDKFIGIRESDRKFVVMDKNFNKIIGDYDYINTSLLSLGLYICANLGDTIEFDKYGNAKIEYQILDEAGNKIGDSYESIYSVYNRISTDKSIPYTDRYNEFYTNLKSLNSSFVGDKYYKNV